MRENSDPESSRFLEVMAEQERVRPQHVPGVRTVLVVLSSRGMVFDIEALRLKILTSYPEAAVFFVTTDGKPVGAVVPHQVDLLIDFTGPRERQWFLTPRRFRRMSRVAIGRDAGMFRAKIYDRVYQPGAGLPSDLLARERLVQREVLRLAGVADVQSGETGPDRGKTIALELPPMQRL
jgi:hypothetical protein